jgi:hypothetical protein
MGLHYGNTHHSGMTIESYKYNRNYSAIIATLQITSYALGI